MERNTKKHFLSLKDSSLFFLEKRQFILALCAGMVSWIFSMSVLFFPLGGLLLSNFSSMPIFVSGFSGGVRSAGLSALVVLLMGVFLGNSSLSLLITAITLGYMVIITRQSLLFRQVQGVRYFYPEGRLVAFLVMSTLFLLGALIFGVNMFLLEGNSSFSQAGVSSFQGAMVFEVNHVVKSFSVTEQISPQALFFITTYGLSFFMVSWVVAIFVNLLVALEILKRMHASVRPIFRLRDLELPVWYPWILVASVGLIFMGGDLSYFGKNASLLVSLGFVFQGCSVVHVFVQKRFEKDKTLQKIVLGFFYGSMILLPWFLMVSGLGILEQFMHLKKRQMV